MLNLISGYAQKKISVKTSTIMFALLSLAMAILVACGGEATSTASTPTASGEQLNQAYQDALAAKDLAKFGDILTDDFVFTQMPGPGGTEQLTVTGKSAFMVRLAGQMEDNTILISSEDVFDGNTAKGKFSLTADNFKAIGVDALGGAYEATTRDGKLASLATFIDGPSLQKLGAAMAALAAATPAP